MSDERLDRSESSWRHEPPTIDDINRGVWNWWHRCPGSQPTIVSFALRIGDGGRPLLVHDGSLFDASEWPRDSMWAPCLPLP